MPELGVLRWRSKTSAAFEVGGGTRRLHPWVWKTATDFAPPDGGWWFDLLTCGRLCGATDAERLIEATPERFVPFADAGSGFQQELARRFVAERAPELTVAVDAALGDDGWLRAIEELLTSAGRLDPWRRHRKDAVVAHVLDWGRRHGVDAQVLSFAVQDEAERAPSTPGRPGPADDLRARLHEAIDCLDDDALGDVLLPARAWAELIRRGDR